MARSVHGDQSDWGLSEQLLALVVDVLQVANWQRSGDKKARRPEPLERPGIERSQPRRSDLSASEMRRRLQALREERREG